MRQEEKKIALLILHLSVLSFEKVVGNSCFIKKR
jgi:hypothetical protein